MNRHVAIFLLGLLSNILPLATQALGLGRIEQLSGLNEPLLARIPVSASDTEWQGLKATLGDAAAFHRTGVERPHTLDQFRFTKVVNDQQRFLQITTNGPVIEPVLDFLIQYGWNAGSFSKRYTLLFSPRIHPHTQP